MGGSPRFLSVEKGKRKSWIQMGLFCIKTNVWRKKKTNAVNKENEEIRHPKSVTC